MVQPDSPLGQMVEVARPGRRPLVRVTAAPWLAHLLIAAGARPGAAADSMTVSFPTATAEPSARPTANAELSKRRARKITLSRSSRSSRQQRAFAVLAARSAIRWAAATLTADLATSHSRLEIDGVVAHLTQTLARASELAATGPGVPGVTVIKPRTYNQARSVGELFREGSPVILDLSAMDDSDARRLVDFSAGLIFGRRGSIDRLTSRMFLLMPASNLDKILTRGDYLRAALDAVSTPSEALILAAINALDAKDWPRADRLVADLAFNLRRSSVPLDLTGTDVTQMDVSIDELAGAYWDRSTIWPDHFAGLVRSYSVELRSGIYHVREDDDQLPLVEEDGGRK